MEDQKAHMNFFKKVKDTAKDVPVVVWVAAVVVPFGLTAIAAYVAYKASKKEKDTSNDRSQDSL